MKTSFIIFILCISAHVFAQDINSSFIKSPDLTGYSGEVYAIDSLIDHKWSVETSLTFPIARIYMLKFLYRPSKNVELGIGPAFQNWKNDDQSPLGQTNAYTLLLSLRYYFWKNFNAEIELWPAWNHFESFVDGKTYKGPELWVEYKIGYRWDISPRFYLNIQPGIAHALYLQQDWPDVDKKPYGNFVKGSIIFVPQLVAGYRF